MYKPQDLFSDYYSLFICKLKLFDLKNKYCLNHVAGDENQVRLSQDWKPGSSDYINAIYINVWFLRTRILNL